MPAPQVKSSSGLVAPAKGHSGHVLVREQDAGASEQIEAVGNGQDTEDAERGAGHARSKVDVDFERGEERKERRVDRTDDVVFQDVDLAIIRVGEFRGEVSIEAIPEGHAAACVGTIRRRSGRLHQKYGSRYARDGNQEAVALSDGGLGDAEVRDCIEARFIRIRTRS